MIERVFCRIHWLYRKVFRGLDSDPFFSASFALSALFGFLVNFILSVAYYYSGWDSLMFKPHTTGVLLLIALGLPMRYFYKRKNELKGSAEKFDTPMKAKDWILVAGLISVLLLGFSAAFIYRLRYLGY